MRGIRTLRSQRVNCARRGALCFDAALAMPDNAEFDAAFAYCRDLVAAHDEDLALCLNYVEPDDRARAAALYALGVELRRIPPSVSEPPLGEIRLQWWRDSLDSVASGAPRDHPVLQLLAHTGGVDARLRALAETGVDARARLLYGEPFTSADEIRQIHEAAEGWMAAALAEAVDFEAAVKTAAGDYAAARWGRALASDVVLRGTGRAPRLRFGPSWARLLYLRLAGDYWSRASGGAFPVAKRLTLFRAALAGA